MTLTARARWRSRVDGSAELAAPGVGRVTRRRPKSLAGYAFILGYLFMLLALGLLPTVYAIVLAFEKSTGPGFAGFSNFIQTFNDYRFVPAFENTATYLLIWIIAEMVLVVGLALLVHAAPRRSSSMFRFVYYLPGALAGAASVVIWLFMLDPEVSPIQALYRALGWTNFNDVASPSHLPVIFTMMAFWTGAGGWIVVLYGALNNVPQELVEAARLDGAHAWQIARRVKLPLIKKWIGYMAILSLAAGSQLFVEPMLVSAAGSGFITPSWSPNELAYNYAFGQSNFNGASAISLDLLFFALLCAGVIVARSGLFRRE